MTRMRWHVFWDHGENWRDELSVAGSPPVVTVISSLGRQIYLPAQRRLYESSAHGEERESGRARYVIVEAPTVASRMDVMPLFGTKLKGDLWKVVEEEQQQSGRVRKRFRFAPPAFQRNGDPEVGYWLGVDEYETVTDRSLPFLLEIRGFVDGEVAAHWRVDAHRDGREIPPETLMLQVPEGVTVERFTVFGSFGEDRQGSFR